MHRADDERAAKWAQKHIKLCDQMYIRVSQLQRVPLSAPGGCGGILTSDAADPRGCYERAANPSADPTIAMRHDLQQCDSDYVLLVD